MRGGAGYEEARRRGWQVAVPERFPQAIVQARSVQDVVDAVRHARAGRMSLAVRGSGHNYTSTFLRDGGVLLDVSQLTEVWIDPHARQAWVQPGVTGRALADALEGAGCAFPTGHNGHVGLRGYLLGGGMGWNGETWGQFACFNVRAVDVVLASGQALTISPHAHPELFWAARGAGPLFCAVATGFHLSIYPAPCIRTSRYRYPLAAAGEIARWLQPAAAAGVPGLELFAMLRCEASAPSKGPSSKDGPSKDGLERTCMVYALSFGADAHRAQAPLLDLRQSATPGALERSELLPVTLADLYDQSRTGPARRMAADTAWGHDAAAITEIAARFLAAAPSPASVIIINYRGPPRLSADAACTMSGPVFVQWLAQWDGAGGDAANLAWTEALVRALEPCSHGAYVNESDILRRPGRLRRCFSAAALERLRAVRAEHDPEGLLPPPIPISRRSEVKQT